MDSSKPGLDLEKELTCSICTELLYHPLTLLDCLHTFCGACLRDWFTWQAHAAENGPDPPAPGTSVFTCPSCRAPVRDTRHNATVASLLDMVLAAHPEKAKPDSEKEEMDAKYRPGDSVLPKLNIPERTAEQLRLEERERNLIESVREMSLLEAVNGEVSASRSRQHRSSKRDPTLRAERNARLSPDNVGSRSEHSRNSSNESRRRTEDLRERQRRHIEHQSSLRSLISSSDAADIDMEREVEEFARQIQEEGLLDGLDLENIDLINNDELSRVKEASAGRQRKQGPELDLTSRAYAAREPHKLMASRFLQPTAMVASAAEDRKAWSTEDPYERLQSGTFCALCFAWSNECYWRCDVCNEGDWMPIAPTQSRFHCFTCVSSIVPDSRPGDYDICEQCYYSLASNGGVSPENGPSGWRRCLQGHRMVVVGFQDGNGGQQRYTLRDLVGGRRLQVEAVADEPSLQRWVWYEGDDKRERLVARDVAQTTDAGDASFPPDGGFGLKASARWAWYPAPGNSDELLFPKGAEITEIEDANGEWYHGVYMGSKGLFPAPYVRVLE
ncbi:hypothetical protein INS49_006664 [Diaporthe citri]|uniref:uncharacterized protein n=1 Tax=Diaporthe citri TaxID=83186 RepID=UPI001C8228C1|nr:uncharacterized protein INS49_006664 [Diaporthe citri]KAG6365058.1 hypothetical protein INS49_006664 [Diaporthe citri]